jgi:uncharacterized protein (TIGR02271 family)
MENRERELSGASRAEQGMLETNNNVIVVPVIEEHLVVTSQQIETGKVHIKKRVKEEHVSVNIPVIREGYDVQRIAGKKDLLLEHPPIRYEGENIIIPVVREVMVIEKRYEVLEEVHIIKTTSETPHQQEVTLKKETVEVQRTNTQQ